MSKYCVWLKCFMVVFFLCFTAVLNAAEWYDEFDDGVLDANYIVVPNPAGGVCSANEVDPNGFITDYVEVFTNSPGGSYVLTGSKIDLGDTVRFRYEQNSVWSDYSTSAIGITYDPTADRMLDNSVACFYLQDRRDNVMAYRHVGFEEELIGLDGVGDPLEQTWLYEIVVGEDNGDGTFDVTLTVYESAVQIGQSVTMTTSSPTGDLYWFCGDNRAVDRVYSLEIGANLGDVMPADCQEVIDAGFGLKADISGDCEVDMLDLAELAADWLKCVVPGDVNCDAPWQQP